MVKKRIGELLVDAGVVTPEVIDTAVREKSRDQKLGDYLVTRGHVKEITLYENLRRQLQIALISLTDNVFSNEVLNIGNSELLIDCVAFPVELSGSLLTVAMADPLDTVSLDRLEAELKYEISPVLAMKSEILDHIDKYYGMNAMMEDVFNVSGIALSDKSDIQMVDTITNYVMDKDRVSVVISASKNRTVLTKGDFFTTNSRELVSVLKFVDKLVGLEVGESKSVKFHVSEGVDVLFVVDSIQRGVYIDHWLSMKLILEDDDGGRFVDWFANCPSRGLVVLNVPNFRELDDVLISLVKYSGDVISYGGRPSFAGFGIDVIDDRSIPLSSADLMGDVFVVDDVWTEKGKLNLMHLLSSGKLVFVLSPSKDVDGIVDVFGGSSVGRTLYNMCDHIIEFGES